MAHRIGLGYDIHAKKDGRTLILGGVTFEGEKGLDGHSDADVLLHAIGDALLGSLALGDLGQHFPPGDARWKDASSVKILGQIRAMIEGHGAKILNVDATVVAERPKLALKRDEMRVAIAQALRIGAKQVSVKATTSEKLGALGKDEGIAAWAGVLVD